MALDICIISVEMHQRNGRKWETNNKDAVVFGFKLHESVDINDVQWLAIVVRYCDSDKVREELCCLKPIHGTTTEEDIVKMFVHHFEKEELTSERYYL